MCVCVCVCVWWGGGGLKPRPSKRVLVLLLRDGMVRAKSNLSDQKKIVYLRKQVELNQVGI